MKQQQLIDVLIKNQNKITDFRRRLVEIFVSEEDRLLCARDIKYILESRFQYNASFDTIYKNLTLFLSLGLVHEKIVNQEAFYFISHTQEHHHHFICNVCNAAYDIEDINIEEELKIKYKDFTITGHSFELYGICPNCNEKNTTK